MIDWKNEFLAENEQPLDRLIEGYSNTSIFRTMAFVGDSLSSGEFESVDDMGHGGYHDFYEYSWGQFIARKNGLAGYNFSRGGMTAYEYMNSFATDNGYWNPKYASQAYVIALGANDLLSGKFPIGTIEDVHADDWNQNGQTFAGYYGKIVSRYKAIQPEAKFFFVTMAREEDGKDEIKTAHASLMYEMAELFGNAYVIDLFKYGPIYDAEFKSRFYLYNHQNPSGYVFSAKMIDSYIDYIIRKHPEDFCRVAYIGTGLK